MWVRIINYTQIMDGRMTDINEATIGRFTHLVIQNFARLLFAIWAGLLLASCATSSLPQVSVADANAGLAQGYRIADGDKLKVTVFDEPTLTGEFGVGLDGSLSLPLITSIQARGQTPNELAAKITSALAAGEYVISPRVSVEVSQHRPFFILGEVKAPGEYPYIGDLTIEQAIAKAQGYSARANKSEVILRRQGWAEGRRVRLDSAPLLIAPGDTITVQEAFF
jgi:polysaccharide biosynthesis/export protein